jgi:hypothetical protein
MLIPENLEEEGGLLRPLNLKNLFQSYFYSKQADDLQESKEEEVKGDSLSSFNQGVIGEIQKNE